MNTSLLNFLKCAECNSPNLMLRSIEKFESGKIKNGFIRCKNCEAVFPILEGVPIIFDNVSISHFLLPSELEAIAELKIPLKIKREFDALPLMKGQTQTSKNWTYQWLEMDTITFNKEWGQYAGGPEKFHYYDIPISKQDYVGKIICEASCGYGRVIPILHKHCARYIAFDLSGAVYKAVKVFPDSEKLDVIRANMHNPPFRDSVFDIVFSPRAIHHTGDMELAIKKLVPTLRTDGIFAYSVYSRENNFLMWGVIEPLKKIFNRYLPQGVLMFLSIILALLVFAIINLIYRPLEFFSLRFMPLHNFFTMWATLSFKVLIICIFDLLHAPYAEYISSTQISKWNELFNLEETNRKLLHDTTWGVSAIKKNDRIRPKYAQS